MKRDNIIEFLRSKDFKLIKHIGQGGTGKTVLLEDETINERFVCKKYSPLYVEDSKVYYNNFVDEIKILHLLYHRNVVRVFNYYLYPDKTTGYILMEYVDGTYINKYINQNPDKINEVFIQTISGFRYLEENNILHRDIRPENILISNNGLVKIIDFGFGKKIDFEDEFDNSISLNWRYTLPQDFESKTYDFCTEVYFVGKLFEEIILENNLQDFAYKSVVLKMICRNREDRLDSFFEVDREIINGDSEHIEFTKLEKDNYLRFADELRALYSKIETTAEYARDIDRILKSLEDCYNNSLLESFVQNPVVVARCFVIGPFYFKNNQFITVDNLKYFLMLLKNTSNSKRRIIINNLWQRLDVIPRYNSPVEDDLPF